MFECRSKHVYNESLGGKRSPDFINHGIKEQTNTIIKI